MELRNKDEHTDLCEKGYIYFFDNPLASWVALPDFASEGYSLRDLQRMCANRREGEPFKLFVLRDEKGVNLIFTKLHPQFNLWALLEGLKSSVVKDTNDKIKKARMRDICIAIKNFNKQSHADIGLKYKSATEMMHRNKVMPYSEMHKRTSSYASFRTFIDTDENKHKEALQKMEELQLVKELSKEDGFVTYLTRGLLFEYNIEKIDEFLGLTK